MTIPKPSAKNLTILAAIIILLIAATFFISQAPLKAAEDMCHADTISKAKHQGAAEIIESNRSTGDTPGAIYHNGYADFVNGWGTPSRYTWFCTVQDGEVTNNVVMEGDWLNL